MYKVMISGKNHKIYEGGAKMGKIVYLFKGGNTMDREITIFDIANTFLAFESMTHKKLQKLCYYAQAWHLALYKKKLFDNDFQAWIHGPVCPELYREYKDYRWLEIEQTDCDNNLNNEIGDFLNEVYYTYGEFSGDDLEYLTHKEDPWKKARKDLEEWEPSHEKISEEIMKEYYWNVYQESQGD